MREARAVNIAELPIQIDREKIAEFCRARGIRKLSLFGSVLRDDFDPQRSDLDVLAEFAPGTRPGLKFFRAASANGHRSRGRRGFVAQMGRNLLEPRLNRGATTVSGECVPGVSPMGAEPHGRHTGVSPSGHRSVAGVPSGAHEVQEPRVHRVYSCIRS